VPWLARHWLRLAAHAGALYPLASLLWDGYRRDLSLAINPIQAITLRTGGAALVLLIVSLACTPANTVLGWRWVLPLRRTLGLYAFCYAGLHFLTFTVLDYTLDWGLIQQAIVEKRYVLAGFGAFVLLAPLAITSTAGWQRRLGKRWKRLHRVVYLAAALAIVHFAWLVKAEAQRAEPLRYGAILAVLLVLRLPPVRRTLGRLRHRLRRPGLPARAAGAARQSPTHP
jgi:sulfoxide reductase heme-binding subunit YedZ